MSITVTTSTKVRLSRHLPSWDQFKALFNDWRDRVRSRCELASLDDRELWDMGLTRMDANNEAEKPFWRA